MMVFQFIIKKKKKEKGFETDFLFFFLMILTFFLKYLNSNHTSLAIHYSQNVFSWFFYLGVHRGTGVFSWLFFNFLLLLSRVTRSRALLAFASL